MFSTDIFEEEKYYFRNCFSVFLERPVYRPCTAFASQSLRCELLIFDSNSLCWSNIFCRLVTMLPVLLNLPQIGLFTMSEGGLTCSYLQINLRKHNPQYQQSSHSYWNLQHPMKFNNHVLCIYLFWKHTIHMYLF